MISPLLVMVVGVFAVLIQSFRSFDRLAQYEAEAYPEHWYRGTRTAGR